MKKKNMVWIILCFVIAGATGCQSTKKELPSVETEAQEEVQTKAQTEAQKEVQTETQTEVETIEDRIYSTEEYGTVEEMKQEFLDEETGEVCYYYEMENFYVRDTLPNAASINDALQLQYDEYEASYLEEAEIYQSGSEGMAAPYSNWHLLEVTYVGEDYISILYNDIGYMGGAHPYSQLDGITIDCKTGQPVLASQLLKRTDEDILAEISSTMGMDVMATWDDIDFYLTDSEIVFFYRMPNYWDDVVLQREK